MSEFWEKYKDPRWQKRRLEKMQAAQFQCEQCDAVDETLHVHHKIYRKGHAPWEYELFELECLCEGCHQEVHEIRDALKEAISALSQHSLHELLGYAQALALKDDHGGYVKSISPMHAEGISAAFGPDDYEEVLALEDSSAGVDLEKLFELQDRRRGKTRGGLQ